MAFFKSKPNLPNDEKARIEFHFQQVVDCLGIERVKKPFVSLDSLVHLAKSSQSPEDIVAFAGEHLQHDVSAIGISVEPTELEKCGGGG